MTRVAVSEYRAEMKAWHDRVQKGERVVVTERGKPIVTLVPADEEDVLDDLERQGLLVRAQDGARVMPDPVGHPGDSMADVRRWRG